MSIKILFSPSEGKNKPCDMEKSKKGLKSQDAQDLQAQKHLDSQAVREYVAFLQKGSEREIATLFGSKTLDMQSLALAQNLLKAPRIEAVRLYNGVGYKALDFANLDSRSQEYLRKNLYIFSNLFGMVRANKPLPYYNLHQGKGKGAFELKMLYKNLKATLDETLRDYEVLDLRAEAYIKAYPARNCVHYYQAVFLKEGKRVSHYAKFYRGLYARYLAQQNIDKLAELHSLHFDFIELVDATYTQNATILTYEIIS